MSGRSLRRRMMGRNTLGRDIEKMSVAVHSIPLPSGAADHGALSGLDGDDHPQYFELSQDETVVGQPTFSPSVPQAPFLLAANAQGQLVSGLQADQLSKSVIAGTGLDTGGVLTSDVTIDHDTGDFGDLHTNYAEHDQVETITGAWTWSTSLIPTATDTYDIGSPTKLWRTGYLSELQALLFVTDSIHVEGGWFIVGHDAGTIAADITAITDDDVGFGKAMALNDFVLFRGILQVEYMKVGTLVSGTRYNVTRNLDGSGEDNWPEGMVFLVLGNTGDGRIELVANQSDSPKISILEQGATYSASTEFVRIGNMRDAYGIGANDFWGLGVGDFSGGNYMKYDDSGGFVVKSGDGAVQIDEDGIKIESGTTFGQGDPDEITFYDDPMSNGYVTGGIQTRSQRGGGSGDYRHLKIYLNRAQDETEAMYIWMTHTLNSRTMGLGGDNGLDHLILNANVQVLIEDAGLVVGDYDPGTAGLGTIYTSDVIYVGAINANANQTIGITLHGSTTEGEIFTLKTSSMTHGMTAITETDTYGLIRPWDNPLGGMTIAGLADGAQVRGLSLLGYTQSQTTTQTTSTIGVVTLAAFDADGTGVQDLGSNGAILAIRNNATTRAIFVGNGRLFLNDTTLVDIPDYEDDGMLLHGLRASLQDHKTEFYKRNREFAEHARPVLERLGIIEYNDGPGEDGRAFIDVQGLQFLTIDAVQQLYDRMNRYESVLLNMGVDPKSLEGGTS